MSVSIVLIPLALAAVSAWQAAKEETAPDGRVVCHVQTRMRDATLLAVALDACSANVSRNGDILRARWDSVEVEFQRDSNGIWQADFTGDLDADRAAEIVGAIDVAYGRAVQATVVERLRERARSANMSVASEATDIDGTITLTMDVGVMR